ncbi:hypothetical protein Y032_0293g1609 [Ancylostoma ceylanicum]|uniref:Uncharacterized protein n=1 Tax=Ancylostoma ceylanicum TaxID=53326 RepID=A0A016S616_9BILA|nr:hypothetical protein Y032_0293g1609 [Ancylostoma ceylanicum]
MKFETKRTRGARLELNKLSSHPHPGHHHNGSAGKPATAAVAQVEAFVDAADPVSFRSAIAFPAQFIFPYADPGRQLISLSSAAVYETDAVSPISYTLVLISRTCCCCIFSAYLHYPHNDNDVQNSCTRAHPFS